MVDGRPVDLTEVALSALPLALAELHRTLPVDETVTLRVPEASDDFVCRLVVGAGFDIESSARRLRVRRLWSLPDTVGPNMALLVCGLNPSPDSADAGVGFNRAGNRFWPAALAAGLVTQDRDPRHTLTAHGVGMTDLVKRPTRRADELAPSEFVCGVARVAALAEWLAPEAICMVGLAGWRAAIDRAAKPGWQPVPLGGRPVYLMPSTSGLNAHDTVVSLSAHLRAASTGPTTVQAAPISKPQGASRWNSMT